MAKKASITQAKYDSTHCRMFRIKLNLKIDADIIERLTEQSSMQGYIKRLIREDIARTQSAPVSVPSTPFATPEIDDKTKATFIDEYDKLVAEYGIDFALQFAPKED